MNDSSDFSAPLSVLWQRKPATFRSCCCAGCCQTGHSSQGSRAALPRAPRTHPAQPCGLLPSSRTSWPLPDPHSFLLLALPCRSSTTFRFSPSACNSLWTRPLLPLPLRPLLLVSAEAPKLGQRRPSHLPPPHLPPLPFLWQLVGISPDSTHTAIPAARSPSHTSLTSLPASPCPQLLPHLLPRFTPSYSLVPLSLDPVTPLSNDPMPSTSVPSIFPPPSQRHIPTSPATALPTPPGGCNESRTIYRPPGFILAICSPSRYFYCTSSCAIAASETA